MSVARRAFSIGLFWLFATPPLAFAQSVLRPVDEAITQADFFTFRAHLQTAIARRDSAAVLAVVHKNIKNSFGGDDGVEAFKRKLEQPASEVWAELGTVLALGGSFDNPTRFTAPYVFSRWPERADSFENVAIVGDRVRIRTAAKDDAPSMASVSFAILPIVAAAKAPEGWTAVRFQGKTGFIASRFVRSPIDYRAMFEKIDGRWQMMLFVAGD